MLTETRSFCHFLIKHQLDIHCCVIDVITLPINILELRATKYQCLPVVCVAKFQDFYREEKEIIIRLTFHSDVGYPHCFRGSNTKVTC